MFYESQKHTELGGKLIMGEKLLSIYESLLAHYGDLHWWPAKTPYEVMVGAVLTQNTAWRITAGRSRCVMAVLYITLAGDDFLTIPTMGI